MIPARINKARMRSRPIVVIAHGLGTDMSYPLYEKASAFFTELGYGTVRFDFYGDEPPYRPFRESTLETEASDLDTVVAHIKKMFPDAPIVVVGHSMGALPILMTTENQFDMAVLWDPAHSNDQFFDDPKVTERNTVQDMFHFWNGERSVPVHSPMVESYRKVDSNRLICEFGRPVQMISAERSPLFDVSREYARHASRFRRVIIAGSDHFFCGYETRLFESTQRFVNDTLTRSVEYSMLRVRF